MIQNQKVKKLGKVYFFLSFSLYTLFLVTVEDLLQAMRGTREEERKWGGKLKEKNFQNKLNIFLWLIG